MRLTKIIKVSDRWSWYGEKTVEVSMFFLPRTNAAMLGPQTVRIVFKSIDDKMVYRDVCSTDVSNPWEWCAEWLWNRMPKRVNTKWMYEHGYLPF